MSDEPQERPAVDPAKAEAIAKAKAAKAERARAEAEASAAAEPWERNPEPPEWREADDDPLVTALREALPEAIASARSLADELVLQVARGSIRELGAALKERHGYHYLVDLCGVDYPSRDERFEVVYHLYNHAENRRVRLKVSAGEETPVPSVVPVWRGADWCEREVWDMYGVRFADHPDLTRILLWEGFDGHPLRKDFPVEGIDTGAAIYPEYYHPGSGPVDGTGTGWKPPAPPTDPPAEEGS